MNRVPEWDCGTGAVSSHMLETKTLYDAPYEALFQSSFHFLNKGYQVINIFLSCFICVNFFLM